MAVRLRDLDPAIFLHKVGIGTDQPAEMLDVVGGNVRIGKTTNGRLIIENSSGVVKVQLDSNGDSYINGGNVGIGAANITHQLTIGDVSPTISLFDTTNDCNLLIYSQDNNAAFGTYSNHPTWFFANSKHYMTLSADGKVGIGENLIAPTANLQIHSDNPGGGARMLDISTKEGNIFSVCNEHQNRDGCYLRSEGSMFLGTNADIDTVHIDGGKVGIGTGSTAPASVLHIRTSTDHNYEFEEVSGKLRLSTLNDTRSVNVPLEFAASAFNFLTGKVGIGIGTGDAPSAKLEVGGSNARIRVHSTNENANQSLIELGSDLHSTNSKDSYMKFFSSAGSYLDRSWAIGAENTAFKFKYLGDRNIPPSYDATSTNPQPQTLFEIRRTGLVRIGATDGASKLNVGGDICLLANNATGNRAWGITERVVMLDNHNGTSGKEFNIADITRTTSSWSNSFYMVEIFAHYHSGGSYSKYFVYYAYSNSGVTTIQEPIGVNVSGYGVRIAGEQTISGNSKRASIMVDLPAYTRVAVKLTHNGVYNIDEWTSSTENLPGRIKYNL